MRNIDGDDDSSVEKTENLNDDVQSVLSEASDTDVLDSSSDTSRDEDDFLSRGVETILKVEGHDSYEVKNGGLGVYPRENFLQTTPSNCKKMIPRLVIMLKPNKIPRLKLYIAITFGLITFLLKSPQ